MTDLEENLLKLKGYGFRIWQYSPGLSTLILRGTHPQKKSHNVEITFVDTQYFQFPLGWDGDFYHAPDAELLEIMGKTGMPDLDKRLPIEEIRRYFHLYKSDTPQGTIYILGRLSQIEYDVEPIYN